MDEPDQSADLQNRFEDLRDAMVIALDQPDLDAAAARLDELAALVREAGWDHPGGERIEYLLRIAHLAAALGERRAGVKDIPRAIEAFRRSLAELRKIGAGSERVNRAIDHAADSLCRLFRYRLPARSLLENFRTAVQEIEEVTASQKENMVASFREKLPADLDHEVSYWHGWSAEAVPVMEEAAVVYSSLASFDLEQFLSKAAVIRMELAGKLLGPAIDDLVKAADLARLAHMDNELLLPYDEAKYLPQTAETLRTACSVHFKLRRFEELTKYAEVALLHNRKRPGCIGSLEQLAVMIEALGFAYLKTDQGSRAVEVLQELVALCRPAAASEPHQAEPHLANALYHLGFAAMSANNGEVAEEALSEAARLLRKLAALDGQEHGELLSDVLESYARLKSQSGRIDLAMDLDAESERWLKKIYRVS